jgi:hypothetical protein
MGRVSRNCIIAATLALAAVVSFGALDTGIAKREQRMAVVTNPSNKGDRLPVTLTGHGARASSPKATWSTRKRPPFGCDPMFSPIADPARAGLYGRCAV